MSIVDDLLPYMRRVQAADRDLHDVCLLWQMIEASSSISCPEDVEAILPTLSQTRARFEDLQSRLLCQLGQETMAALGDELSSVAQCTIDILVRNLYERTADVGFLATDDVLRAFCAASPEERDAERGSLRQRLAEYRAKYTVYDDVVVLAPDGRVLVRLDESDPLPHSADGIVAEALARDGYVERFGVTDLAAAGVPALLYGQRIVGASGSHVGVLVLRFRIRDEMDRIFGSLGQSGLRASLMLIDEQSRVIMSNDETHVPLAARIEADEGGAVALCEFGGREYLGVTRASRGYQGYRGPAWRAHAMVSLVSAFRSRNDELDNLPAVVLDNAELRHIQGEVDAINRNLRRIVWNGHLVANLREGNAVRLKAVLEQVNMAGTRTRDRVASAIQDLYVSTLGRARKKASDLARLAADIMDRNLYERANDCRWWALSPVVQSVLAAPADEARSAQLNAVLTHINSLYTVYTRLVAFDTDGRVRGVSNDPAGPSLLGSMVEPALLAVVQAPGGTTQSYSVTPFAPSPLSEGVPTYIYLAAVRQGAQVVGGMAIVFNAAREFRAILDDVLDSRGGVASFVDSSGRIVACTDDARPTGGSLPFGVADALVEHDDTHFAAAQVAAEGYREFKCEDGYSNQVRAVVALRLGSSERRRISISSQTLKSLPLGPRSSTREVALFQVGAARFALPAHSVLEARSMQGLLRTPGGSAHALGLLEVSGAHGGTVVPVFSGRALLGINGSPRPGDGVVIVMGSPRDPSLPVFGLCVDDVLAVVVVGSEHFQAPPSGLRSHAPYLAGLLRMQYAQTGEAVLVQLIAAEALTALAGPAGQALPAAA